MADAVTVTLGGVGDKARAWVAEGRYASMSEVVREGIKALDRENSALIEYYRSLVSESLADPRPRVPLEDAIARVKAAPFPGK
jgi:antitoxin ParD1/3/4